MQFYLIVMQWMWDSRYTLQTQTYRSTSLLRSRHGIPDIPYKHRHTGLLHFNAVDMGFLVHSTQTYRSTSLQCSGCGIPYTFYKHIQVYLIAVHWMWDSWYTLQTQKYRSTSLQCIKYGISDIYKHIQIYLTAMQWMQDFGIATAFPDTHQSPCIWHKLWT